MSTRHLTPRLPPLVSIALDATSPLFRRNAETCVDSDNSSIDEKTKIELNIESAPTDQLSLTHPDHGNSKHNNPGPCWLL